MNSNANGSASLYQSANSSTSTLRPRNTLNRLISYEDSSSQNDSVAKSSSASSTPPRVSSRSASPTTTSARLRNQAKSQPAQLRDTDRRASGGLWESWSSFQGLASSFLASDPTNLSVRRGSSLKKPKGGRMVQDKSYGLQQSQTEWGPKSQPVSSATPVEDQKAILQAKKREAVLLQSVDATVGRDSLGRYKRKDSNASMRSSPIEAPNDGDVLVYRHKVQPQDTMAGVVIKYSCQPEAFRKVNRFWPNDNIQRKDYVILPVDACALRGRKTESPYVAGLFGADNETAKHPLSNVNSSADITKPSPPNKSPPTEPFPLADTTPSNLDMDSPYRHDCWVLLPTQSQPVEILRISKRALGYFPPARRKSISTSTSPANDSGPGTPKSSFDMLRHPPTHAAQQAQLNQQLHSALSSNASPSRQSSLPRYLTDASRTRSSSTVSTSNGTSKNAFLSALSGPGGVGTLRGLRTEKARPGPGEDSLNKKFAHYVPDLLPSDHPDYQSSSNTLKPPRSRGTSNSLRATPRASIDSIRSTRSNSSSVPAAIAGWVGKVASSPMRKKAELNRIERIDMNLSVLGEANSSDLIELADTPDEISRQLHDDVEERTPSATPVIGDEELMNERFPVRGRVRRAYEND